MRTTTAQWNTKRSFPFEGKVAAIRRTEGFRLSSTLTVTTPDLISFGHPLLPKDGSVAAQKFVSNIITLFFNENEVRENIENPTFNIPYSKGTFFSSLLPEHLSPDTPW